MTSSERPAFEAKWTWSTVVGVVAGAVVALAALFLLLAMLVPASEREDILRAWRNPPQYDLVRRFERARPAASQLQQRGDFDGDGVEDAVEVAYLHRMCLIEESTSGMVYVRSGATGEVLLAHPVGCPINEAHWCGDIDGDGRDDVWSDSPEPGTVFAFRAR